MSVFNAISPIFRLLRVKNVDIYNSVFKLNSRLTVMLLLIFSVLVSAHEILGEPMQCDTGGGGERLNDICWINGTYIIPAANRKMLLSPGIPLIGGNVPNHEKRYQLYYQWIGIILIIQAILFYLPGFVWKIWEHGHLSSICENLDSPLRPTDYDDRRRTIVAYLNENNSLMHGMYAFRFAFCELLNVLMVGLNMWLLNMVFAGFWWDFAPAIRALFAGNYSLWKAEAGLIFPIYAKCDYTKIGVSGSITFHDALCMLTMNSLNEKIFTFMWLWLIGLAVVATTNVCYRTVWFASSTLRLKLLQSMACRMSMGKLRRATCDANVGECFFLLQIGRNVHPIVFGDIMETLAASRKADCPRDV